MLGIWIIIIVIACVMEIATQLQLVSVWAAVGGVAALVADVFGVDDRIQIVIFFVVTFAFLAVTRPIIRRFTKNVENVPMNADMNIGKTGRVTKIVDESSGIFRVNLSGDDWSAVTKDRIVPEIGSSVKVEKIEGVKLIVSVI